MVVLVLIAFNSLVAGCLIPDSSPPSTYVFSSQAEGDELEWDGQTRYAVYEEFRRVHSTSKGACTSELSEGKLSLQNTPEFEVHVPRLYGLWFGIPRTMFGGPSWHDEYRFTVVLRGFISKTVYPYGGSLAAPEVCEGRWKYGAPGLLKEGWLTGFGYRLGIEPLGEFTFDQGKYRCSLPLKRLSQSACAMGTCLVIQLKSLEQAITEGRLKAPDPHARTFVYDALQRQFQAEMEYLASPADMPRRVFYDSVGLRSECEGPLKVLQRWATGAER